MAPVAVSRDHQEVNASDRIKYNINDETTVHTAAY